MTGPIKGKIVKARDRFLEKVNLRLEELSVRLKAVENEAARQKIDIDSLLDLARAQLSDTNELKSKYLNSGIIPISDKEIVSKMFNGQKIYLNPRDLSVAPHLALDAIYESSITGAWISTVKPNQTVIDVGANFGYFGLLAAQVGGEDTQVIFFEANPELIPYIEKSVAINREQNISKIENLAVADKSGTVTLNVLQDHIGSSSLHSLKHLDSYMHGKMYLREDKKVRITATTIDDYCKMQSIESIDLIKMDIEGYEEKAYQGMRQIIKRSPEVTLFIEFTKHSYEKPKRFYEQMLKDFGNVYKINDWGKILKPRKTDYVSIVKEKNDWTMLVFSKLDNLDGLKNEK